MNIIYKEDKNIDIENIERLFKCVDWTTSSNYELTKKALANSSDVFSAWDDNKLVGLVYVIADGGITVHVHYLLVLPEYRNKGIGSNLMNMVIKKYKNYVRMYLESKEENVSFYSKNFNFNVVNHLNLMKKELDGKKYLK